MLHTFFTHTALSMALGLAAACASSAALAQSIFASRATELRADKLPTAEVLAPIAPGAALRLVSLEGGWAYVELAGKLGWVRASMLNLQAGSSAASGLETGRQATGGGVNAALTLGVRSLPARSNRHALIIGVSLYADKDTPPLPGARIDRESATQMASAMQVPASNITYLQDSQATGANIRKALGDLNQRVQSGDRVFVHYSGHGTRYNDPTSGGCIEALLAYDGGISGTLTNREMSELLKPITAKNRQTVCDVRRLPFRRPGGQRIACAHPRLCAAYRRRHTAPQVQLNLRGVRPPCQCQDAQLGGRASQPRRAAARRDPYQRQQRQRD